LTKDVNLDSKDISEKIEKYEGGFYDCFNLLDYLLAVYHFAVVWGYEDIKTYLQTIGYAPSQDEESFDIFCRDHYLTSYKAYLNLEYLEGNQIHDVNCRFLNLKDISVEDLAGMLNCSIDHATEIKEYDDIEEIIKLDYFAEDSGVFGLEFSTFELNGDVQRDAGFDYINMGDQYSCTIIHDKADDNIYVTDWTSFVEYQDMKIECFKNNLEIKKEEYYDEDKECPTNNYQRPLNKFIVGGTEIVFLVDFQNDVYTVISDRKDLEKLEDYDPDYKVSDSSLYRDLNNQYADQF
jgi:hypothetical protein